MVAGWAAAVVGWAVEAISLVGWVAARSSVEADWLVEQAAAMQAGDWMVVVAGWAVAGWGVEAAVTVERAVAMAAVVRGAVAVRAAVCLYMLPPTIPRGIHTCLNRRWH